MAIRITVLQHKWPFICKRDTFQYNEQSHIERKECQRVTRAEYTKNGGKTKNTTTANEGRSQSSDNTRQFRAVIAQSEIESSSNIPILVSILDSNSIVVSNRT